MNGPRNSPWLLVFDLDGTLIDSSLDLCLAVNAALVQVGSEELPHEVIAGYIGDGAAMLMRRALGDPGDVDSSPHDRRVHLHRFEEAFRFFLGFYRVHKLDNTRLYDGVLPALRTIRAAAPELPMAVLTNKPVRPSREICAALEISQFFFANYGGDSFPTKKPDPTGLGVLMQEARAHLGENPDAEIRLPASGVVMVGDSEVDVVTARRLGVRSLGCLYGLSPHTMQAAKPDLLCTRATEWPGLLGFS